MIEFDYKLDYKNILFKPNDKRYRIGRGEQGVLLVRPYTNDICKHWRFKTLDEAKESASTIFNLYFYNLIYNQTLSYQFGLILFFQFANPFL